MERILTKEELAKHDGTSEEGTIYVAIKGIVFDVTAKKAMYGPTGGYHCFAGKDSSKVTTDISAESSADLQLLLKECIDRSIDPINSKLTQSLICCYPLGTWKELAEG